MINVDTANLSNLALQESLRPIFRAHDDRLPRAVMGHPASIENAHVNIAVRYLSILNKVSARHLPIIRNAMSNARLAKRRGQSGHSAGVGPIITFAFAAMRQSLDIQTGHFNLDGKVEVMAKKALIQAIRDWQHVVQASLGVRVDADYYLNGFFDGLLAQWMTRNIRLIHQVPQRTLSQMEETVRRNWQENLSNNEIAANLRHIYGVNKRQAEFWARDQMGNLYTSLNKAMQQDAGVKEYIWLSSNDDIVRDAHAKLNGKRFEWANPPIVDKAKGRRAHPGENYNCRCVAQPIFHLPTLKLPQVLKT